MKALIFLFLFFVILSFSCKDNSVTIVQHVSSRAFTLTASKTTANSPCDITFTGTFHYYTDSTIMNVPDMFLMGLDGKTFIPYALPDTTVPAKRVYTDTRHFSSSGSYLIYMMLQTTKGFIISDTLAIKIR